jgi:hypothetical protein
MNTENSSFPCCSEMQQIIELQNPELQDAMAKKLDVCSRSLKASAVFENLSPGTDEFNKVANARTKSYQLNEYEQAIISCSLKRLAGQCSAMPGPA